ncbi:MAG TPA: hypothetical protein VGL53_15660 [Bryobacteraceae bacterium]|jgi:hypothetical protein
MRPLITLAILVTCQARSQSLVKHTFDTDTGGWLTMGTNGSVAITHDKASVKAGAGALEYKYSLDGQGINTAILPLGAPGSVAAMGHVKFWIKSDHDTAIGVVLSEKKPGGGDYTALVWTPANAWQHIDLVPADFTANDGPNDPVDADGKLDPAQIEAFGIIDVAQLFNHLPTEAPIVVARSSGSHTILLDDFEITDAKPPASAAAGNVVIDRFDRGFSQWITLGGMTLALSSSAENPIAGPTLTASIQTVEGKLALLTRRIDGARIEGTKRIAFDIAADHEGTFVLSIEVKKTGATSGQGPRYNFEINPPEGRKVFRVNVSLADFEADENSAEDPAGKLEAGHIKSISIGDITALAGGAAGPNKIWIGPVEMVR